MFVLHECSVCLEDYSTERAPHSIACGHVFCRPCLEQLATHSPNCPTCRVSYSSVSIRKISCAFQDSASNSRSTQGSESESDTILWQVIQSAVECPEDAGLRKSLITLWSEQGVSEENLSENALASFALLNLLVHVEDRRQALEEKLETAQAVEQSLCDRISGLETQLSETTVYPSARDFKSFMSDFQKLQLTVDLIHKNTSDTTRRPSADTAAPPQNAPQEQITALSQGSSQPSVPQIPPGNTDTAIPIQVPQDEPAPELNFSNNPGRASACFVPMPTTQPPNYAVRIIPPRPAGVQ